MTPFDKVQNSALHFAENMLNAAALMEFVPTFEKLEQESLQAVMRGDSKLMADILIIQDAMTKQLSIISAEA
jgi:hypothetical protein|tara:strand:- start:804 stop:1019 length:216 start_codon:yes stop_codon:yes gene_type:complete